MIPLETLRLPVTELSQRIRARSLSPVALTDAYLERLRTTGAKLSAVATLTTERARAQARLMEKELAAGRWRGPLHGVPYVAKDLLAAKGYPTTWGAAPFAKQMFAEDATVIARLDAAGAVLLGKAAMIEIAGGFGYAYGSASATGAAKNPWDRRCWTCGSSSGSGASVSASLAPFAIASETWGSILCPAAHCGVTGLRPTYGRVSRHGAMALSYSLDKLGPLARTVGDCALVLAAIAGYDAADPASLPESQFTAEAKPRAQLRLGWMVDQAKGQPQANVEVFAAARAKLTALGFSVEDARLPDGPWGSAAWVILSAEAASAMGDLLRSGRVRELADPLSRTGGYAGAEIPADDLLRAQRIRGVLQAKIARVWERFDVLVGPSRGEVAFRLEQNLAEAFDAPDPMGASGNLLGLPAVGVPCGFVGGLPLGLQFMARPLDEHAALQAAATYQNATDWHLRHPSEA
jgi:aspartyl-tRNA(Asn)/glutamyl-tRNA(Gln) amidotransferase subunit A